MLAKSYLNNNKKPHRNTCCSTTLKRRGSFGSSLAQPWHFAIPNAALMRFPRKSFHQKNTCGCFPEALPYSTNQNLRINKMPQVKSSYSTKQPQHSQHCSQVRAWHCTSPRCASVTTETHSSVCTQLTQTSKQCEAESLTTLWIVPTPGSGNM